MSHHFLNYFTELTSSATYQLPSIRRVATVGDRVLKKIVMSCPEELSFRKKISPARTP